MKKLVIYQSVAYFMVCFVWFVIKGIESAWSAFLGGLVYFLSSILAFCTIKVISCIPELAVFSVIFGLITRIIFSLLLLVVVFIAYSRLLFLPFITGLIAVSLVVFLFFGICNHDSGNYRSQDTK